MGFPVVGSTVVCFSAASSTVGDFLGKELKIAAVDYYEYLQVSTVDLSPTMPPRGHIDGGALASTTNRKEYLWSYHQYNDDERSQVTRLKVADDTVHVPTGTKFYIIVLA